MFGRTVTIGDESVLVFCTPETPLSEVCRIAAEKYERMEIAKRAGDQNVQAFRAALQEAGR